MAGQRALFEQEYPLAWGNAKVTPDLFLTGIVTVRPDLKSATVVIEAFGPNSPKQDKVVTFQVDTDRSLLADLNQSFQVKSRKLKRRTRNIELDEEAVSDAAEKYDTPTKSGTTGDREQLLHRRGGEAHRRETSRLRDPLRRRAPAGDLRSQQPGRVSCPRAEGGPGRLVRRPLGRQERIGLVLMVNGKSTLYEEPPQSDLPRTWHGSSTRAVST